MFFFELTSPHLARGRYDINYDRYQSLFRSEGLTQNEKRHLKALVRRLELVNWRQIALFRILDMLCYIQRNYIQSHNSLQRNVITQRQIARRLSVAPSTINRAIQGRSIVLPWEEEILLEGLFCSRKNLCLDALDALEAEDDKFSSRTDQELQKSLQKNLGFPVPRRTINTYRRTLKKQETERGRGREPEQTI